MIPCDIFTEMDGGRRPLSEDSRLISAKPDKKGLSVVQAAMMIAGSMAGTGVLALPSATEALGALAPLHLVILSLVAAYTGILLARTWSLVELRHTLDPHTQDPYPLLGQKAMGKTGRVLVKIVIYIVLLGTCTVYLLLSSDIISDLIKTLSNADFSFCYVAVVIAGVLIPLNWLGTPKDFWVLGVLALLSTAFAGVVVTVYTWYLSSNEEYNLTGELTHKPMDASASFMAIGTMVFSQANHPVFPTVQQDMKDRTKFHHSIIIAFLTTTCTYLLVSMSTYYLIGDRVGPNIFITLTGIQPGWPIYLAELLLLTHCITGFLVNISPVNQDLEELFKVPNEFCIGRVVLRTFLVLFILFVGESIPRFAALLSLFGGSAMTAGAFILPILIYEIITRQEGPWEKISIPKYRTILHVFIMLFGVVVLVSSTYFALVQILGPDTFVPPCYVNVTSASI